MNDDNIERMKEIALVAFDKFLIDAEKIGYDISGASYSQLKSAYVSGFCTAAIRLAMHDDSQLSASRLLQPKGN